MSSFTKKHRIYLYLLLISYFIPSEYEVMRYALYENLRTTKPNKFENNVISSYFKFGSGSPTGYIPWHRLELGFPTTVIKIDTNKDNKICQGNIDNFKAILNAIFIFIIYMSTRVFILLQKWIDNIGA